jgi:phage regulatory protein, rha family|nr:MAG TPA: KilAC domain protein [Bacteriophage sp.]
MTNLQTLDKKNLLVGDAVISIQGGLYSLNDLHRASGGEAKHQPANFLRLDTTQALIDEISNEINRSSDVRSGVIHVINGNGGGTYVCKELVYAYAMWVSAAFNLRVIRAFDAGVSAPVAPAVPQTLPEALRLAADIEEQRAALEAKVAEDAPKVEFYHDVTGSDNAIDMATVAKVLNRGIGRNRLFAFLREAGVLDSRNAPYQRFVDMGWFRQVETKWQKANGDWQIGIKTVVFQKGVEGIARLLDKKEAA